MFSIILGVFSRFFFRVGKMFLLRFLIVMKVEKKLFRLLVMCLGIGVFDLIILCV